MAHVAFQNGGELERFDMDLDQVDDSAHTPDFDVGEQTMFGDLGQRAFSGTETPADTAFARTKREEELVLQCILQAQALGAPTVDLSGKHLMAIPDELMQMEGVEYLYLEGNEISFLPDEFFKCLPKLKWLDLRNNRLTRIPSIYLSSHRCLRNLLVQNNQLKSLPLELGLVKTLHGLNITNNPLEFPPQDVIERGTYEIQKFLREMLQAKSSAKTTTVRDDLVLDCIFEDSGDSSSSDDWNTNASMMELARQRRLKQSLSADTASNTTGSKSNKSKLVGPMPLSAEMYRSTGYNQMRKMTKERLLKASAGSRASPGTAESSQKTSSVLSWKVNPYPEPPSHEYLAFKVAEEKQLAKVREMKEKTDTILQRRKDNSLLKDWRDDAKKLQAQKRYQTLTKGTKDYPETAEDAPFGVDKPYMKMMNNEDRFKETKEKPRRALSPASRARIEEEKAAKIRELEQRIKDHTSQMADRRRKPRGTPQEEMEAAKRELDVAEDLHRKLMHRQKNVEYRLKEFEADVRKNFPVGTRLKH
ncbi:leucine-rich repeat-containing protein 27-like isoform X2 [Littorina saxatilis]|uniref:Leucine-rich repeat-containing protein 27 n=1 Tax=Littorina saxatilis TaxID=31220 RepID=A0AAN9BR68_9CAEN